jgi:hypothetical protein
MRSCGDYPEKRGVAKKSAHGSNFLCPL